MKVIWYRAFPQGHVAYGWYKSLTDKGVFFATRLRPQAIYQVIERQAVDKKTGLRSEQTIQLNSAHALKRETPALHLPEPSLLFIGRVGKWRCALKQLTRT